ncbi:PKD domain protein, partial [Candidatus Magnetomorum sp. HK-1]
AIQLDDYVSDIDNNDSEIIWTVSGQNELTITINNRVATITIPNENWNGNETVLFTAADTGGLTATNSATFAVNAVNDAPTFTIGQDITINEDSGEIIQTQWATNINPGASNETDQTLEFHLTTDHPELFSELPAIDSISGTLSFIPEDNVFGSSQVTIILKDDQADNNTSQAQQFTITINAVNDPPSFTMGADLSAKQNTLKTVENWATQMLSGPSNETNEILTFHLNAVPSDLFIQQPAIDSQTGSLTFKTSAINAGTSKISVFLADNGDGTYTSGMKYFMINVTSSDPPVITGLSDQHISQDSTLGPLDFIVTDTETADSAVSVSATSSNVALVKNDNIQIISNGSSRQLTLNPISGEYGTSTITVYANDGSATVSSKFQLIVHPIPEATIGVVADNYGYTSGTIPLSVHFTPTLLQHAEEITGWRWEFSDGGVKTDMDPIHTFYLDNQENDPSVYEVQLTVFGYDNATFITKRFAYIHVESKKSIVFIADKTIGTPPHVVQFSQISTGFGDSPVYSWNFGDGNTSDKNSPSHTYAESGNYTVTLSVSNGEITQTYSSSNYIQVQGRKINGFITANDTGNGLNNCVIEIWHDTLGLLATGFSNADGSYDIQELPAENNLIVAVWPSLDLKDVYDYQYFDSSDTRALATRLSTEDGDIQNLNVALHRSPEAGIRGRLMSANNPQNGMSNIEIKAFSESLEAGNFTSTDTNGYYTLTGLKPSDDYIVSAWSDTYQNEFFFSETDPNTPETFLMISKADLISVTSNTYIENINIYVMFTGCISGHVSADGQAIPNIWVTAINKDLDWFTGALADYSGNYSICGLPAEKQGTALEYWVYISSSEFPFMAYNKSTNLDEAMLLTSGQTNIDFQLQTGTNISGQVIDNNGTALSGVLVIASSASKGTQGSATTDSSGYYTLSNLPIAKDYVLKADAVDYPILFYNDAKSSSDATFVDNCRGDVSNILFIMQKGGVIRGYIKINDALQSAGPGHWVNAWSSSTQTATNTVTDAQGMYEITGLDENVSDFIISIKSNDDFMPAYYNSQGTVNNYNNAQEVQPSETVFRNIILTTGYAISGKIIDSSNNILEGIMVSAVAVNSGGWGYVLSKNSLTDGYNYQITGLPPGGYEVCADADNYIKQCRSISVSNNVFNTDFELYQNDRQISGTIYGLKAGQRIELWAHSDTSNIIKKQTIFGTGQDITYEISGLPGVSDYIVELISSHVPYQIYNNQKNRNDADEIDLSTQNQTGIDFNVASDEISISGKIYFPDKMYQTAWVDISDSQLNWIKGAYIEYTGVNPVSFQVSGLDKDMYIVSVWPSQGKSQYYLNADSADTASLINATKSSVDNIVFTITSGVYISGNVYNNNGLPAANVDIFVSAKNADLWRYAVTNANGYYIVNGLKDRDDYIVEARRDNYPPIYYNKEGIVMTSSQAGLVSSNTAQVDLTYYLAENISGTVQNMQSQPLSGIRIVAESDSNQILHACYTLSDGSFTLKGLPVASDYVVQAIPSRQSLYQGQSLSNISIPDDTLYFVLSSGYTLNGVVTSENNGTPISKVSITVSSIAKNIFKRVNTNSSGEYEVTGLPQAFDYAITATPKENSSYVSYQVTGLQVKTDTTVNIELKYGLSISGYVRKSDDQSPIANVLVTVFSQEQNFMDSESSNADGSYTIANIPNASDYVVTARPDDYAEQSFNKQSAGSVINFVLDQGGSISGYVTTTAGVFKGATVEACSSLLNICQTDITNDMGYYEISSLKQSWNGSLVTDYVVSVYAAGYPNMYVSHKQVGDTVNFTLTRGTENELSGTVSDSSGALVPKNNGRVWVKAFKNTEYITKTKVKKDGSGEFTITGLQANTKYQLKIKAPKFDEEWVGADGVGTSDIAGEFTTKDEVAIRFSTGTW